MYRFNNFWLLYSLFISDLNHRNKAIPLFDSVRDLNFIYQYSVIDQASENQQINEFFC